MRRTTASPGVMNKKILKRETWYNGEERQADGKAGSHAGEQAGEGYLFQDGICIRGTQEEAGVLPAGGRGGADNHGQRAAGAVRNKENDLAFVCDSIFYFMAESQATVCPNISYRLLEYITAGLRSTVDSEPLLYGRKRVYFPVPKLYLLQTGLERNAGCLPGEVQYDVRLSDSYVPVDKKYGESAAEPDLEAVVHVYDFRMTLEEMLAYIEQDTVPGRFGAYAGDMRDYALTANGITYVQRAGKDERYVLPGNAPTVAAYLELLKSRGIFVDLLNDKSS